MLTCEVKHFQLRNGASPLFGMELSLSANHRPTGHRRLYKHRQKGVWSWINYQTSEKKKSFAYETETGQTSLLRRKVFPARPSNRFENTSNQVLKFSWRSQTMNTDTIWSQMKQTTAVGESMAQIDNEVDFIDIGMDFLALTLKNKLNLTSSWFSLNMFHYFSSVAQYGWSSVKLGAARSENSWIIE